jgi:hypothetical protein
MVSQNVFLFSSRCGEIHVRGQTSVATRILTLFLTKSPRVTCHVFFIVVWQLLWQLAVTCHVFFIVVWQLLWQLAVTCHVFFIVAWQLVANY